MIIFISIILIWFLLFAYNQIDFSLWQPKFWYFYQFELNNLEKTNFFIIGINVFVILALIIYFLSANKKIKKVAKTNRIERKPVESVAKKVKKIKSKTNSKRQKEKLG